MTIFYLVIFAGSLLLAFVITKLVRDTANRRGWVCPPASDRHLHSKPLPRLGGVAIFAAFILSLGMATLIARWVPSLDFGLGRADLNILLPGVIIFALGVYDDVRSAGPYLKFAVQAVAGAMLFASGLQILDLPVLFGSNHFPAYIGLPLTIAWVIAITNAFNLIDGLDGLAAGSALFSTIVVFVVSLLTNSGVGAVTSLALAGAILGFLRFNFNPATIFLGDCGSLFVGFMLSALALRGAQKAPTIIAVAIPVVSFGLPILETALSVLRRFISGRPVFTGDREHIHHKLLQLGFSHRQVVILLYAVSALFALLSVFLLWPTGSTLGLVLAVVGTGVWLGVQRLGYLEFGELRRVAQRTIEQRQIFVNNLAIRRATEELKVADDYGQICHILEAAFAGNDFDGFDLHVDPEMAEFIAISRTDRFSDTRHAPSFSWNKLDARIAMDGACWKLTLDLVTASGRHRGTLSVHRLYSERDLQLDINLLTSGFPVALAEALDRSLSHRFELIPTSAPGLLAAQAG